VVGQQLEFVAEEFFEMVGGTLLLWAVAEFLVSHGFRLTDGRRPA
jgi:hypothetical protein